MPNDQKKTVRLFLQHPSWLFCSGLTELLRGTQYRLFGAVDAWSAETAQQAKGADVVVLRSLTSLLPLWNGIERPLITVLPRRDTWLAESAIRIGSPGVYFEPDPAAELMKAVRAVLNKEIHAPAEVITGLLGSPSEIKPEALLSPRQLQVFNMIGDGWGTRHISEHIGLSIKTIETYRENIKSKLGLANGEELLQCAMSWRRRNDIKRNVERLDARSLTLCSLTTSRHPQCRTPVTPAARMVRAERRRVGSMQISATSARACRDFELDQSAQVGSKKVLSKSATERVDLCSFSCPMLLRD